MAEQIVDNPGISESGSASTKEKLDNIAIFGTIFRLYRELWILLRPSLKEHFHDLKFAYAFSLGRIAASVSLPYFLALALGSILPEGDPRLFYWNSGAVILALLFFYVSSAFLTHFLAQSLERGFCDMRIRLVESVMRKPTHFFVQHDRGDLLTRISQDTESLSVLVFDYLFPNLYQVTGVCVYIIFMLAWRWHLGLYTLLSMICYILMISFLKKPLAEAAKSAREQLSEQNTILIDILDGIKEIRSYQQLDEGHRRFMNAATEFSTANIRAHLIKEWSYSFSHFLFRFVAILPFLIGGYLICRGSSSITVGELIAYNLYMANIVITLNAAINGLTTFVQQSPLLDRINEIFKYPDEEVIMGSSIEDMIESTRIEFQGVCFSHQAGIPILNDFNLTIEPGQKVAVIGPSGSGKSTLIELLTRCIKPDRGQILISGRPVGSFHLPLYLQNFSYVRQTPCIFRISIKENIALGWYGVPPDAIIDAAKRAKIHDAIMQMPDGYDSVIGAKGCDLSGGQLQRLAIARALIRDPAVLLLDECTSALDCETEETILDDLFRSFAKQTILCVTHSEKVAGRFERIIRLEKQ